MGWRKEYWKESWNRSTPKLERGHAITALVAAVIAIVSVIVSSFGFNVPLIGSIPIGIATFLVVLFGAYLICLSPMTMWKELHDKVTQYENTDLAFIYHENAEPYKRDFYDDKGLKERLWRVGTGSVGRVPHNKVQVKVVAMDPTHPDLPRTLHPMEGEWESDGSFDLRAGACPINPFSLGK